VLCCWDEFERVYKICDGPQESTQERWAYAQTNWVNGSLNTSFVPCDSATGKDGVSTGIDIGNVYLPRGSNATDPNVRAGQIIAYTVAEDGFKIAKGYLDDCIGKINLWSGNVASIPEGWQLCDGTNGTQDCRDRFIVGAPGDTGTADFDYDGHSTNIGATGGLRRELINWEHTRFGDPALKTELTYQFIEQPISFETLETPLVITATAYVTGYLYVNGYTEPNAPLSILLYGSFDVEGYTDETQLEAVKSGPLVTEAGQYTDYALAQGVVATEGSDWQGGTGSNAYFQDHVVHVHPIDTITITYLPGIVGVDPSFDIPYLKSCAAAGGSLTNDLITGDPHISPFWPGPPPSCTATTLAHEFIEPGVTGSHIDAHLNPLNFPNTQPGHPHPIPPLDIDYSAFVIDINQVGGSVNGDNWHSHHISTLSLDASSLSAILVGDPHVHYINNLVVDASPLVIIVTATTPPHKHTVASGTLDGKLTIRDLSHSSPLNAHYHDIFIDNHQEFIKRIPPYLSLAYIQRVD
jgi:hypothetical protein